MKPGASSPNRPLRRVLWDLRFYWMTPLIIALALLALLAIAGGTRAMPFLYGLF